VEAGKGDGGESAEMVGMTVLVLRLLLLVVPPRYWALALLLLGVPLGDQLLLVVLHQPPLALLASVRMTLALAVARCGATHRTLRPAAVMISIE